MKVKKIRLGLENVKHISKDSKKMENLKRIEYSDNDNNFCFENIKEFRKAITPKRIELLHITRKMKPKSLNELARFLVRDVKSISIDLHLLEKLGLINLERKKYGRT